MDDSNWSIARDYLVEKRGISSGLVEAFHSRGLLYANNHQPNPSVVFLHRDLKGAIRGATLRDTKHQSAFRLCLGNKSSAWFVVGDLRSAKTITAVESPIDALSYYCLKKSQIHDLAVVSCAGIHTPEPLLQYAHEKQKSFIVALDNDQAGQQGWSRTYEKTLHMKGFVIFPDYPHRKDWNEDLVESFGLKTSSSIKL